jgi:uncharacterized protein (DUF1778 family)
MARPKAEKTQDAALRLRLLSEHEGLMRQAAALAGLSLSAWMRERLIRIARREIADAGRYEAAGKAPGDQAE